MVLNTAIRLPVSTYKVLTFFAILYVFSIKKRFPDMLLTEVVSGCIVEEKGYYSKIKKSRLNGIFFSFLLWQLQI